MSRTIEDLLATSMREAVTGLTPDPDLVARAARRYRQRARVRRAASVTGFAGIAAAVAISLTVASASGGNAPGGTAQGRNAPGLHAPVRDDAYVVSHVENALTAAGRGNRIFFSSTTQTGSNPGLTLAWNTRDRFNEMEYTSPGHLFFSLTVTRVRGGLRELVVQYLHQLVGHQLVTGTGSVHGCATAADILETLGANPNLLTNWPATIRALVACKLITSAGHQRAGLIRFAAPQPGFPGSLTMLVNASTFLPSRMVVTSSVPGQKWQSTTVFGSLPPTRANLAHLSAPIPAGFTQINVPPESAGQSVDGNEMAWMLGQ
jgi:hypothetical protein